MNSQTFSLLFTLIFVGFLLFKIGLELWLKTRQIRNVMRHRSAVPPEFAQKITLEAHQKAADYTVAKVRYDMILLFIAAIVLLGFTLFGGFQWLSSTLTQTFGQGMAYQLALIVAVFAITTLIDLPSDYYFQFVLERKFGFNKMSVGLWLHDLAKNIALMLGLFLPLVWLILFLMEKSGTYWWLYAWMVWCIFSLVLVGFLWPHVIAPWFNKFWALEDPVLRPRLEALLQRVQFAAKGLFVTDGSRRSSHSNAYFSGFGPKRKVVLYDTLIAQLTPAQLESVLAHELGHFKLKHSIKRMVILLGMSLPFMALLGYLKQQTWFYEGLGVTPILTAPDANNAMALLLILFTLPVFTFVLGPLASIGSRKHEFEADAFAAQHTDANDLISSLVTMYEENASTVTPDPLHSIFYDSHPPAAIRIGHLQQLLQSQQSQQLAQN